MVTQNDNSARGVEDRPKLLDLFCGAGGCSVGYSRVGFVPYGIMNCPNCKQTIRITKNGLIPFHKIPKAVAPQFGRNYVLGAYCVLSRCSYETVCTKDNND